MNDFSAENVTIIQRKVKQARVQIKMEEGLPRITLITPYLYQQRHIEDLLAQKSAWIEKTLTRMQARQLTMPRLNKGELLLFGDVYRVQHDTSTKQWAVVDTTLRSITSCWDLHSKKEQERWYRQFASHYLHDRLRVLADTHNLDYSQLSIRNQKTRWGSCTEDRNISLNWRLIKTPLFASDYVMLHELVHTHIMNHSPAFWAAVQSVCPDYKKATAWFKQFGHTL
ncbi:MAG: M48 family metallopeptidase [Gammaproteobacteria bacterium]|nr:M48 family metallopeptidase [Gammaproteobacteria bacterium]